MKIITTYFKYLLDHKLKIAWIIATNLIICAFSTYFFKDINDILGDNSIWVIIGICSLITTVIFAIAFQPFDEWKDSLDKKEKEEIGLK